MLENQLPEPLPEKYRAGPVANAVRDLVLARKDPIVICGYVNDVLKRVHEHGVAQGRAELEAEMIPDAVGSPPP